MKIDLTKINFAKIDLAKINFARSEEEGYPPYLEFSASAPFTLKAYNEQKNWDGFIEYSIDKETWTSWDGTTISSSSLMNGASYLFLRGKNLYITNNYDSHRWQFSGQNIFGKGDIRTLLNYEDVNNVTINQYGFSHLFRECNNLVTAPDILLSNLSKSCCFAMFYYCTSLSTPPKLSAENLAEDCYMSMFSNCTSLIEAPVLPATTLVKSCYNGMFYGCTGLQKSPILNAKTLVQDCYKQMFRGCNSLEEITMLATDISASNCLYNWVYGANANGTFYKDSLMTTLPMGVNGIPSNWTVKDIG